MKQKPYSLGTFEAIIFDFGKVLLDVDYEITIRAFKDLGCKDFEKHYQHLSQTKIFDQFETGKISGKKFCEKIRENFAIIETDETISNCWNAMLGNLTLETFQFIQKLSTKFPIFLLSNTNILHEESFTRKLNQVYGEGEFFGLFTKIYLSHKIGMRKPNRDIFEKVLFENKLIANRTLFLDDSPQHIAGAASVGLKTILVEDGKTALDYFPGFVN